MEREIQDYLEAMLEEKEDSARGREWAKSSKRLREIQTAGPEGTFNSGSAALALRLITAHWVAEPGAPSDGT